jgi:hypothetical protein
MSTESDFAKIDHIVERVLIEHRLEDLLYFSKIVKYWTVIVGDPLARKSAPAKLKKKALTVLVKDGAYSHHLRFFERNILDLIASPEICGEGVVTKVIFKTGFRTPSPPAVETDPVAKPDDAVGENRPSVVPADIAVRIDTVAAKIDDRVLRRSFARLMRLLSDGRTDPDNALEFSNTDIRE